MGVPFDPNIHTYAYNTLTSNRLLNELDVLTPLVYEPTGSVATNTEFQEITPELLQSFEFQLDDIERVFREADTYRDLRGIGNNQLTYNELYDYLIRTRGLLAQNPSLSNDVNILQVFLYYFPDIADRSITTGLGQLRALSAQQIQNIAGLNGNSNDFAFGDITHYLGFIPTPPTDVEIARRLQQSELVIRMMPATGFISPIRPPSNTPYHIDEPVMSIQPINRSSFPPAKPDDVLDIKAVFQPFSFTITEVKQVVSSKKGYLTRESLIMLLKLCDDRIRELSYNMMKLQQTTQTATTGSHRDKLMVQLAGARQIRHLVTVLNNNFSVIATIDGHEESISLEDINYLAALDGNSENVTLEDLQALRRKNAHQPDDH